MLWLAAPASLRISAADTAEGGSRTDASPASSVLNVTARSGPLICTNPAWLPPRFPSTQRAKSEAAAPESFRATPKKPPEPSTSGSRVATVAPFSAESSSLGPWFEKSSIRTCPSLAP
jgi:hypothetical protein